MVDRMNAEPNYSPDSSWSSREDIVRLCIDCDSAFAVVVNEQQFYASKGFPLPRRCPHCRSRRRGKRSEYQS
jgi:hypothetical protein